MSYLTKPIREKFGSAYYRQLNYRDYLSRKFDALAADLSGALKLTPEDRILDFGCGYGGLVAGLHAQGFKNTVGTDISQWSIEEGHRRYRHLRKNLQFYNRDLLRQPHDILIMLDVLEHMPEYEVKSVLKLARKGKPRLFAIRIPVCSMEGEAFVLPVSNNDPTHICCHSKEWWHKRFQKARFSLQNYFSLPTIYDSCGVLAATFKPQIWKHL